MTLEHELWIQTTVFKLQVYYLIEKWFSLPEPRIPNIQNQENNLDSSSGWVAGVQRAVSVGSALVLVAELVIRILNLTDKQTNSTSACVNINSGNNSFPGRVDQCDCPLSDVIRMKNFSASIRPWKARRHSPTLMELCHIKLKGSSVEINRTIKEYQKVVHTLMFFFSFTVFILT